MTDLEHGLCDTSWVAAPPPLPAIEKRARRGRQRRFAGAGAVLVLVIAALPVVTTAGRDDRQTDVLQPPPGSPLCPETFVAPEPTARTPTDRLFPVDVTRFQVCVYEDAEVDVAAAALRLRGAKTIAEPDVAEVRSALEALRLGPSQRLCLRSEQSRVLVIGRGPQGNTSASLSNPCGSFFSNGRTTAVAPGPELRSALGLGTSTQGAVWDGVVPPGAGTACPARWPELDADHGDGKDLAASGVTRIDVCAYGEQRRARVLRPAVRESRVLLGDKAARAAALLASLRPPLGAVPACLGGPPPGLVLVLGREDGTQSLSSIAPGCGAVFVDDGLTRVMTDDATLRALLIDPDDPSGPLL